MKEKYGFVYIWYDRKHKRYYIGSHWGTEDDGYICSSSWMKRAYKLRPEDFKRRILDRNIDTKKETFLKEEKWLSLIKNEELGKRYYNLKNTATYHWAGNEIKTKTVSQKILESRQKYIESGYWGSWSKGKSFSDEHKQKLSEAKKGKPSPRKGQTHTEEAKEKMRQANLGKQYSLGLKRSEETKKKISISNKGKNKKTHCKKGHALEGYNAKKNGKGITCRICINVKKKEYAQRKRRNLYYENDNSK